MLPSPSVTRLHFASLCLTRIHWPSLVFTRLHSTTPSTISSSVRRLGLPCDADAAATAATKNTCELAAEGLCWLIRSIQLAAEQLQDRFTSLSAMAAPDTFKALHLNSHDCPVVRMVSTKPPRDCTEAEIPVVDLAGMHGDVPARRAVARALLHAAETTGFFYIANHGVDEQLIRNASQACFAFFRRPADEKARVSSKLSKFHNGWTAVRESHVQKDSTPGKAASQPSRRYSIHWPPLLLHIAHALTRCTDRKESFQYRYDPRNDPLHQHEDPAAIPAHISSAFGYEDFIWTELVDQPDFQASLLAYWRQCLALSRTLIRLIALALDLPEDYFAPLVTYPALDAACNFYPGHGSSAIQDPDEVGIGAHTDLQVFTLLWQDNHRGLQVLNKASEWVWAPPRQGTFVVNIGDFLMRLTNDRLKSTVHRVIQHGSEDRLSMPTFFGFNWNEKCGVVPTCVSEHNPAKYEPITCGEVRPQTTLALNFPSLFFLSVFLFPSSSSILFYSNFVPPTPPLLRERY